MNTEDMKEETDVVGFIKQENARRREEAPEGSTLFLTAPGVGERYENVYEFELDQALETYSDAYKEKNGFRPRLPKDADLEEVREMIKKL